MNPLATPLLELLPQSDRAAAEPLLVDVILPIELRGLASHPKPDRYTELVMGALSEELQAVPAAARMNTVRMQAERARLTQLSATATQLGVARYLLDHPDAQAQAGHWLTPDVHEWMTKGRDIVLLEAVEHLNEVDRWGARVRQSHPQLYQGEQSTWHQSRLTLQSTISGSYATTGGTMADFIRAVGGKSETLPLGH